MVTTSKSELRRKAILNPMWAAAKIDELATQNAAMIIKERKDSDHAAKLTMALETAKYRLGEYANGNCIFPARAEATLVEIAKIMRGQ